MSELHFITIRDNSQDTRSLIKAEIDRIDEKYLDEIYNYILIKKDVRELNSSTKQSLMSKLRAIKIDAPEDFAENFDLYLRGEKQIETDIR
jgi:DNA topoisomerase VI subunit B